jgi:hypothetical protein
MADEEERVVAGPSRWTKNRAKKKLLTDEQLMECVPSFQQDAIRAAKRQHDSKDETDLIAPRNTVDTTVRKRFSRSTNENENIEV